MYYFYERDDKVEKYLVTFDKEKMEEIRKEVINNCSMIEHFEYYGTAEHHSTEKYEIRNLEKSFLYKSGSKNVYHYSYDKYIYSELVFYITELLKGNTEVLKNGMPETNIEDTIEYKIKEAEEAYRSISDLDIEEKQKSLEILERLYQQEELNKNQQPINFYWTKLHEIINLELVSTYSIDEFYQNNCEYKYTRSLKREIS